MAKEDEEFRAYLEANGYDASQICGRSEATTVVDDVTSDKEEGLRLKSLFLPPPRIYPYVGYQFWHFSSGKPRVNFHELGSAWEIQNCVEPNGFLRSPWKRFCH